MTRTTAEPDSVLDPDAEGHTPPRVGDDSASPSEGQSAPESSGSDPRRADPGRWHDVAKLLAAIWAVFSSLLIGVSLSVGPYYNPADGGPVWTTYAAAAALAPWAVVFLVWKWPAIGAFALLAAFLLWLVFASQSAGLSYWACVLLCPGWLALPPAAALALHLQGRRAARLAGDPQPPTEDD